MNSPWGKIWNIAEATGWSVHYILWGVAWINIQMMMADAPRYLRNDKKKVKEINSEAEMAAFLGL